MNDGKFHVGEPAHMAGTLAGKPEGAWQALTGNKQADFFATRRVETGPWFSLVGVIANDGDGGINPGTDGSPSPHRMLRIGAALQGVTVSKPGYFHAFTNDAWHFTDNKRGSVQLTIRRV
jgi:hypothetical protein